MVGLTIRPTPAIGDAKLCNIPGTMKIDVELNEIHCHSTLSVDHKFVIFEKEWYKLPESDDDLLSDAVLSQEAFVKQ